MLQSASCKGRYLCVVKQASEGMLVVWAGAAEHAELESKGSHTHKAAVDGDTVDDPTAGHFGTISQHSHQASHKLWLMGFGCLPHSSRLKFGRASSFSASMLESRLWHSLSVEIVQHHLIGQLGVNDSILTMS